jgi:hypothetical protein
MCDNLTMAQPELRRLMNNEHDYLCNRFAKTESHASLRVQSFVLPNRVFFTAEVVYVACSIQSVDLMHMMRLSVFLTQYLQMEYEHAKADI